MAGAGFSAAAQVVDQTEHRLRTLEETRPAPEKELPALQRPLEAETAIDQTKSFTLTAISVRGATVFKPERFAPLYDSYLARRVTLADIAAIAQAITDLYRKEGYFLSRAVIPPQDIEGGYVVIDVLEGYVSDVQLLGDESPAAQSIIDGIVETQPTRLSDIEHAMLLISDLRGVRIVRSAMAPDVNDLRRYTLALTLKVDRIAASIYSDNRGTEEVGRTQTFVQGAANSALLSGDQIGGGLFFTPIDPNELLFGQLYYTAPIGSSGLYATFYGAGSRIRSGGDLAAFDVEGESVQALARLSYPLVRTRAFSLWGNVAFSMRRVQETLPATLVYEDKVRTLIASVNATWRRWGGVTTFYGEFVRGLGVLDASDDASAPLSRANAGRLFTRGRIEATRTQNFGEKFQLYVAGTGQTADGALLSSEEFAFGGSRYGRAYDYAAIAGDDGVAAAAEFRFINKTDLPVLKGYQVFAFYDVGKVWNNNPLPFERDNVTISSAGAGLRLNLTDKVRATYEAARPVDGLTGDFADEKWRHFFSLSASF
ncbi:MAG: POTRA domain-containing protein [Pseudomonadota bacterium]|nr:POTRA domain-containing protein [Pseudomonadota bacterium]